MGALLLGALYCAARSVDEVAGGDPRTIVVAAGLALSLLLTGLAVNGWEVGRCIRAAWIFPATLLFTGVAMLVDTNYGNTDGELVGGVLVVAGLAGGVLYGHTLARLRGPSGADARTSREPSGPEPWMRALGVVLLLGAAYFAVQLADAVADGDWRRLVAAVGYGTAVLVGGLGLNGWQSGLSLRLVWLFPATMSFLGMTMIADPDYGDPTWSGAAAVGDIVVHFGSAMVVAGVFGFLLYASAVAARPVRHR